MDITATTNVTLSGAGCSLFRPGGALNTGANSRVLLAGGACSANVFWAPVGAATIGASAALSPTPTFVGDILSAAGVAIGHFAHLTGRGARLRRHGHDGCQHDHAAHLRGDSRPAGSIPTLSEWAMILLSALLAVAGMAAMRKRSR